MSTESRGSLDNTMSCGMVISIELVSSLPVSLQSLIHNNHSIRHYSTPKYPMGTRENKFLNIFILQVIFVSKVVTILSNIAIKE